MKLPLTITRSGLSALIDAGAGTTNAVRIASMGLTDSPFVTAPSLNTLPGEHTRLNTVSGNAVSETVLHVVASDNTESAYTVTGIGLYLDTGDLFGVFSLGVGEDAIFEKAAAATFLFAADITFEAGDATLIEFGDANFLNPPATETQKGVAYLATADDMAAGTDGDKIVTPARAVAAFIPKSAKGVPNGVAPLDATGRVPAANLPPVDSIDTFYVNSQDEMLVLPASPGDFCLRGDLNKTFVLRQRPSGTLGNWAEFLAPGAPVRTVNGEIGNVVLTADKVGAAPASRLITPGGLVRGGGDLSADRSVIVDAATSAEVMAGLEALKAVTPASLATLLNDLAGRVPAGRRVDTSGLASGGGDLNANRTINVPKGTGADVEAMVDDTKALTAKALAGTLRSMGPNGYLRIPGTPLILMWGEATFIGGTNVYRNFYFPISFPQSCLHVFIQQYGKTDDGDEKDETCWMAFRNQQYFNYGTSRDILTFNIGFIAIGF